MFTRTRLLQVLFLFLLATPAARAQTKVFKEVAEDISSQMETIRQDGNLIGYLVFTQLEKASVDSFNYKISIMDENLNDIGSVTFREEKLFLKAVSFEQDVLCLAYIRSNFVGKEYKNNREFRRSKDAAKASLFAQFVDLKGNITGRYTVPMDVKPDADYVTNRKMVGNGRLKQQIQLRNITGIGFACFYGDDSKNSLLIFNASGKLTWQKTVKDDATDFVMLTSGPEVSLLMKKKAAMKEGGFEIASYNALDSTTYPKFLLQDKKGNSLKVLAFDNDPNTGKPYVSGLVIDPRKGNHFTSGRDLKNGTYCGLFSIGLNGHHKNDIQPAFSYWNDGTDKELPTITHHGYINEVRSYDHIERSFKDYQGNTYFAGEGIRRHPRWGALCVSVAFSWTVLVPLLEMAGGTHRYYSQNVLLLKQDPKGELSVVNNFPTIKSTSVVASFPVFGYDNQPSYYNLTNTDTKTDYVVVSTAKDVNIYDVRQHKTARNIPHKDGNSLINVMPAKEGYVMVSEYNRREKFTRYSIEAL
jgi:hypothetical protein